MTDFFMTAMGRSFYESAMPRIARALSSLAEARDYEQAITMTRLHDGPNQPARPYGEHWRVVGTHIWMAEDAPAGGLLIVVWERPVAEGQKVG